MKYLRYLVLVVFFVPTFILATLPSPNFQVSDIPAELGVKEEFSVSIYVDTLGQKINGVEFSVQFSPNLEFVEINENDSVIPLWIKRPDNIDGEIKLAGIIPGGFSQTIIPGGLESTRGKILSIILRPKKAGGAWIKLSDQAITLHDGIGTQVLNNDLRFETTVLSIERPKNLSIEDLIQPDLFYPKLARDDNVFDGDLVLYFETRDFESGIDRYEVREDGGEFVTAESPYRLRGQDKVGTITVRAIDRAGNDRTVELTTGFRKTPSILWPIVLVLVVALLVLVFVHSRKRSQ